MLSTGQPRRSFASQLTPSTPGVRFFGADPTAEPVELDFVFIPAEDDGWPWPRGRRHHRRRLNPNREGSPLAFWRKVKDALRNLTFADRRGSYIAPGPHGRRNNIVREPLPHGAGDPPVLHGGGIARIPGRRPHLDVPPFPPTDIPVAVTPLPLPPHPEPPQHPRHPTVAARPPLTFRGEPLGSKGSLSYRQEVLFEDDSDKLRNKAAAQMALREVVALMQRHPTVHVTILGNAASSMRIPEWPFGGNKTALLKAPSFIPQFSSVGKLMLARARAIANLIISRGISPSRVHYDIGQLEFDKDFNRATRKRRATIVIEDRR